MKRLYKFRTAIFRHFPVYTPFPYITGKGWG